MARPVAAAPVAAAMAPVLSQPAVAEMLALDIEGMQIPLRADGNFDLSAEPDLDGRGAGVVGTIVPHPTRVNVLGLRNSGTVPWTARLRDGSQQTIERDQNLRLAAAVQANAAGRIAGSANGDLEAAAVAAEIAGAQKLSMASVTPAVAVARRLGTTPAAMPPAPSGGGWVG